MERLSRGIMCFYSCAFLRAIYLRGLWEIEDYLW